MMKKMILIVTIMFCFSFVSCGKEEIVKKETNLRIERLIELDVVLFDKGLACIVSDRLDVLCILEGVDTEEYLKALEKEVREYAEDNDLPTYIVIT